MVTQRAQPNDRFCRKSKNISDADSPHEILHPRNWKAAKGYANGVAATGRMVFTGGVVGWDANQEWESDDLAAQVAQCLLSIKEILAEAGAAPHQLTRLT